MVRKNSPVVLRLKLFDSRNSHIINKLNTPIKITFPGDLGNPKSRGGGHAQKVMPRM